MIVKKKGKPLYHLPESEFKELVKRSTSIGQISRAVRAQGYTYDSRMILQRIAMLGVDVEHFKSRHRFKLPPVRQQTIYAWMYKMPEDEFRAIAAQVNTMKMFFLAAGNRVYSAVMSKKVRERAKELGVSLDHFLFSGKGKTVTKNILVKNSPRDLKNTTYLRNKLIREGHLKNECSECGMGPHWQGKPLRLQLYRLNAITNDLRPDNLKMMCPNCWAIYNKVSGRKSRASKLGLERRKEREQLELYKRLAR